MATFTRKKPVNKNSTAMDVLEGMDLSKKTIFITGANTGIGFEAARALAMHGAHVVMGCRNLQAAEDAKQKILQVKADARVDVIHLDCAKLASVEQCAKEYAEKGWRLDALINNAGVYGVPTRMTEDGFESAFQINYLSQFYLVQLLLPVLQRSAPARVVQVSSTLHRLGNVTPETCDAEHLSPTDHSKMPSVLSAYGKSKLCQILFSNEFNRRYAEQGIVATSLHPGGVRTEITRHSKIQAFFFRFWPTVINPDKGASTSVYMATAPELEGMGGVYYDRCTPTAPHSRALNESTAKKLWDLSQHMIDSWKNNTNQQ